LPLLSRRLCSSASIPPPALSPTPPPSRSPLFPYTTLFRSVLGSIKDAVRGRDNLVSLPASGRILVNAPAGAWVVQHDGSKRFLSDRKSTRLNSSHQIISYAVFCLKKKTLIVHRVAVAHTDT